MPSEAIEVLKSKVYAWEPCKKNDEKRRKRPALLRQLTLLCKVGSAIAAAIARFLHQEIKIRMTLTANQTRTAYQKD